MTLPSPQDLLRRIPVLYHFTDRRNLPAIRERGGLYPLATLRKQRWNVPAPGSSELSRSLDESAGMDAFVHLCFRSSHPMEHVARQEGRIIDSIFLYVHPEVLQWEGVRFTPDVANKAGVSTYPMQEATQLIDFEVLYARTEWRRPEIQQRLQRAEKAEILVPHRIPLELIRNLPNG